jgi:hypothetical protein
MRMVQPGVDDVFLDGDLAKWCGRVGRATDDGEGV